MGEMDFFSNAAADLVIRWAEEHTHLADEFRRQLEFLHSGADVPQPPVTDDLFRLYCAGKVLADSRRLNRFLSGTRSDIGQPLYSYLLRFKKERGFFSSFTVTQKLDEHLYQVYSSSSLKEFILYSRGCSAGRKRGCITFFGFICPGNVCFHTMEPVLAFRGISPEDLEYLAFLIDPGSRGRFTAAGVFGAQPLPFLNLLTLKDPLPLILDEEIIEYCFSIVPAPPGLTKTLPDSVTLQKRGNLYRCLLSGPGELNSCSLYVSVGNTHALLLASTRRGYRTGAAFFSQYLSLPEEPDFICSTIMARYIGKALKVEPDIIRLRQAFDEYAWEQEDFVSRPPPVRLKRDRGMPDFTAPQGGELGLFAGFFSDNHLFILDTGKETETLYQWSAGKRVHLFPDVDLPENRLEAAAGYIEEAHRQYSGTGLQTILLYSLYLLKAAGKDPLPVSMYAFEYLSVPWRHFNPPTGDLRELLAGYAGYAYTLFAAFGLAEFDPPEPTEKMIARGDYSLGPSDFFRSWIVWRDIIS